MRPLLPLLALAALFAGCASPSRQLVPLPSQRVELTDRDRARVYVARSEQWVESPRDLVIYDDEVAIGILSPDTFLCWERAPGPGRLQLVYKDQMIESDAAAGTLGVTYEKGRVHYLSVSLNPKTHEPVATLITAEAGAALIGKRKSPAEK